MSKRRELLRLVEREEEIQFALKWAEHFIRKALPGGAVLLALGRERRSKDQNAKLWPMCQDIALQCDWHDHRMPKEEWKDLFVAGVKRQKAVPNLDNDGFVIVGGGSSNLDKRQFSELIELIYAFGAERGVEWSEKSRSNFNEYREVA